MNKKTITRFIKIGFVPLLCFYVIALTLRLTTIALANKYPMLRENYLFQLSTGLGPAIGAFVAMAVFKRKTEYTLTGKSVWKSVVTILVPCLVFGIIGGWNMGGMCLLAFTYGLLEEYGWRGFLQYELRGLPMWQYVLIITVMWFLWHLDFNQRNLLPFFVLLLFASWGIGKVMTDTHSLLFCAAFHGIVNFSKHGLLADTTFLITFVSVIAFWIVIWYFIYLPKKQNIQNR
ncbi:MAG: CPBP family intramembrane metalloprotease [Bacteroidaceae bacterium]|nr:CPBP family intramembrane metalloprotease [Bacteroidaceae bacterium]